MKGIIISMHTDFCQHQHINKAKFISSIKELGYRLTSQRQKLIDAVFSFNKPFCADDLISLVKKGGINDTTVYRFLNSMVKMNLIKSLDFEEGFARFEINDQAEHHHHILCTKCKTIVALNGCILKEYQKALENMGYTKIRHKLEFFGLCKKCSK